MAYRRTQKMQKRVTDRRRSIIEAAEKLFAEKGYESTTMQQIADEAGTSIGNMYFYFSNKEELMLSMIDELCEEIWDNHFNPEEFDISEDHYTMEAIDDYLKVHTLFSNITFAKSMLNIAQHRLFRNHIILFLENKTRERYKKYEDFFEGLDREIALSYHLGGLVNMFEKILSGELKRTPHEAGLFLAKSKLLIRGLDEKTVENTMANLKELIPKITAEPL